MDLAVTGGIGSGKSTVAAMLADKGGVHLNADAVVHELQQPGSEVFQGMVELFGEGVVASDGTLDRQAVAEIVFADEVQLQALNDLVHPAVRAEMQARREAHKSRGEVVISEIPLLVEGRLKQVAEAGSGAVSAAEVFAKRAAKLATESERAEQRAAKAAAESKQAAKRLAEAHKSKKGAAKKEAKQAAKEAAKFEWEAQRAAELAAAAAADAEAAAADEAGGASSSSGSGSSSSSQSEFDAVVVVMADREVVLARLAERGLPREEALARMAQQATDEQRQAIADYVIDNSGDLEQLRQAIDECWEWLRARQSSGAA